ncbi:MAG: MBL fold metallo-hydrolase [Oscillospiraceae bacterium]|nr:MBL fold metallo-hydrolase [Oscillospiraceae bacterium]
MKIITIPVGSLATNCYLAYDEESRHGFVVDPGDHVDRILHELKFHQVTVEAILLTHAHFDHIMAVPELIQTTGAKLYVGAGETPVLEDPSVGMRMSVPHLTPDVWVKDGEILTLAGMELTCLNTPGHTPGSICYLTEDTMFSGDTLFCGSCGRCDFPGGSVAEMYASLKRLASLPGNFRVLPGHDSETTLDRERRMNPYVREALLR